MESKECYSCPYAKWTSEEGTTSPKLECDPPMGECQAEFKEGYNGPDYPPGTNAGLP